MVCSRHAVGRQQVKHVDHPGLCADIRAARGINLRHDTRAWQTWLSELVEGCEAARHVTTSATIDATVVASAGRMNGHCGSAMLCVAQSGNWDVGDYAGEMPKVTCGVCTGLTCVRAQCPRSVLAVPVDER